MEDTGKNVEAYKKILLFLKKWWHYQTIDYLPFLRFYKPNHDFLSNRKSEKLQIIVINAIHYSLLTEQNDSLDTIPSQTYTQRVK